MNIFQNANTKVEKFSVGIKDVNDINKISNGAAANEILKNKAVLEHCDEIERSSWKSEAAFENKKQINKVANRQLFESQMFNRMGQLHKEGRVAVFKEILFEAFSKSLYLDEEFIVENYQNLKHLTDSYVDENGGYKILESAIIRTGSPLLKKIAALCEATTQKTSQRKMKQCQEESDLDCLDFDLDDDEKDTFDYEKGKVGLDELSDMVKSKVLTVVQDEKLRQQKEEELYSDIETELSDDDSVTDENSVNEALSKILVNKSPIEEGTLFNALLRSSYKGLLENQAVRDGSDEADEDTDKQNQNYDVNAHANDIDLDMGDAGADDSLTDEEDIEFDMDLVLAEAITKYTLMETMYTLQLENYSVHDIEKLTQKLLNS